MKYIKRTESLEDPIFASFISAWQKIGNPSKEEVTEEGEYYDEKTDSSRFFSQSELNKIRDQEINDFTKITDQINIPSFEIYSTIVIDTPYELDEVEYMTDVLSKFLEQNNLEYIFIPLFKLSWFHEDIKKYTPLIKLAYSNFKIIIGEENASNGFIISNHSELKKILPNYFTLIQGDYISKNFFYSETLKTIFSFHYSGELWIYNYSKESMKILESFINENNLIINKRYTTHSK